MSIDTRLEKMDHPADAPEPDHGVVHGSPDSNGSPDKVWTPADSARLYGISNWGQGYFSVNPAGHVAVHPHRNGKQIDLKKLVDELRERDIQLPVLIRFTDILQHRLSRIHEAFQNAIKDHDYKGRYRCVYPIKVNQQKHVVEEIHS